LLSSHDLAEIESFASHVGYLEQGRILFSEEMPVLSGRFREIIITLSIPSSLPQKIPPTWLQVEAGDSVIRFVDSNFRGQETAQELAEIFPSAGDIAMEPMPLRSIFLALAKTGRTQTQPAPDLAGLLRVQGKGEA
jgi:ABC-2 type transport system ATP-binding protein